MANNYSKVFLLPSLEKKMVLLSAERLGCKTKCNDDENRELACHAEVHLIITDVYICKGRKYFLYHQILQQFFNKI
jgi:hypothetical protein